MALFGNLGPIFSGIVMTLVSRTVAGLKIAPEDAFEKSLKILTVTMVAAGGIISWLHHFVHSLDTKNTILPVTAHANNAQSTPVGGDGSVSTDTSTSSNTTTTEQRIKKIPKPKLSFFDSVKVLMQDKYLMNVAMMVVSYGLTMEFTEIIWKSTVKKGEMRSMFHCFFWLVINL
jgi:ATP/ADP translocase